MGDLLAPGLTADWLNAWLAAIGVTVLVPGIRLGWSADPLPVAHFDIPVGDVVAGWRGHSRASMTLDTFRLPERSPVMRSCHGPWA